MNEHAMMVAERWARKRAEAIADGAKPADFDNNLLALLFWGGWNINDAHAILKRVQRLSEKEVSTCEQS